MADTAITISPTRVTQLSEQEYAATGYNTRFRVLYTDIAFGTGSTDTVTMTLGATPANYYIDNGGVNISTAFAGTGAMTLIVGTTASTAALISSTSILTKAFLNKTVGTPIMTNLKATATVNLVATFTNATSGSPSELTAGQLDIYAHIVDVAKRP
jgi:hypothetical protein